MIKVRRLKLLSYVPVKHKVQLADGSRQIEEEETACLALPKLFLIIHLCDLSKIYSNVK